MQYKIAIYLYFYKKVLDKIMIKLTGGEPVVLPVSRAVEQTADMEDIYMRIVVEKYHGLGRYLVLPDGFKCPAVGGVNAVSYTHLDVYKRQVPSCPRAPS